MKQAIEITDIAKQQVAALIQKRGKPTAGVRVGVKTRGCSGLSYTIEYADDVKPYDEVVNVAEEGREFKILIDPKAIMFLLGRRWIIRKTNSNPALNL